MIFVSIRLACSMLSNSNQIAAVKPITGLMGISLPQLWFWQFFAIFGQPACQLSCSVAPKGGWPSKLGAFAMPPTKMGTQSPTGKGMAWVPKHHFPLQRVLRFLLWFQVCQPTIVCSIAKWSPIDMVRPSSFGHC